MGTLAYMSPEQERGEPLDARTDLFSFGAVLYEMCTGRRAFGQAGRFSVRSHTPVRPQRFNPQVSPELERIVYRLLEKDRNGRYPSAALVRADLESLAPGGTQTHGRRLALAGVGVAGLALAGGGLWYTLGKAAAPSAAPPHPTFVQLTDRPGTERYPSLSPDGSSIAFASNEMGSWDVYLQPVGGGEAVNLTMDWAGEDTHPAFSPDGSRIAFRSDRDGGGIFVMSAAGDSVRRLSGFGYNPSWSPDGRRVVVATEGVVAPEARYTSSRLWVIDVADGQATLLSEGDAVQPVWSPGGHRIAYWAQSDRSLDVWTIPSSGGPPVPVTRDASYDWNPAWSPDGRHLYFASDRGGTMNLWRVRVEEETGEVLSEPEPITTPSPYAAYMSALSDGRGVAYTHHFRIANLYRLSIDPAGGRVLAPPQAITRGTVGWASPAVSPDGAWLAFVSTQDREDLFLARSDGTELRQLTDDVHRDRFPRWSPDGTRITFYSDRSGAYQVWSIAPDGSGLERLTDEPGGASGAFWSPDGRRLAYVERGAWAPRVLDATVPWRDQVPGSLSVPGQRDAWFLGWSWSPDGDRVAGYFLHRDGRVGGVAVASLATGAEEARAEVGLYPLWLDAGRVLFYEHDRLYLLDVRSGEVRELLSTAPDYINWAMSLSPDRRTLYLSLITEETDIWLARFE